MSIPGGNFFDRPVCRGVIAPDTSLFVQPLLDHGLSLPDRSTMGAFEEIRVQSIGEIIDRATPTQPDPSSGRFRSESVYKGAADANWPLWTSLDRLGGTNPAGSKAHLEEHILRNFIRHASPYLPLPHPKEWELLIIAQHHGVPTRLFDWSYSPLIAAHFATLAAGNNSDRVIWKLNWKMVHQHFGFKELAFLVDDLAPVLKDRGVTSPWDLFRREPKSKDTFVCMLDPPALDARIVAQSATFTLCSDKQRSLDQFLLECGLEKALIRYVIPADKAEFIRDQLDLCTIDEKRFFPGLDGVAAELTRYYAGG